MKLPLESNSPILLIAIGFLIGAGAHAVVLLNLMNSEKVELENDARNKNWIEADKFLTIAESIKNKKYNEALSFSENMLNLSVISITKNGTKTSNFTEYELGILNKVKSYKEKECSKECLKRLSGKYK